MNEKEQKQNIPEEVILNTRINIHKKYSSFAYGFGTWLSEHYRIPEDSRVFVSGLTPITDKSLITECGIDYVSEEINASGEKSFDAVIMDNTFSKKTIDDGVLKDIKRILKEDGTFYAIVKGENGSEGYLSHLLQSLGVEDRTDYSLTLQNGEKILSSYFNQVTKENYEDNLQIPDQKLDEFLDYLYSFTDLENLMPEDYFEIKRILGANEEDNVLTVPIEYGIFICS